MTSNLTKVSLALLSAVFILGCQDTATGPLGPDGLVPQFDKRNSGNCGQVHCHGKEPPPPEEEGSFTATLSGDVSGVFSLRGPQSGQLRLNSTPGAPDPVTLSRPLLGFGPCFDNPPFAAIAGIDESGWMQMYFTAEGTDGSEVRYGLNIYGALEGGAPWPPTAGNSNTITGGTFTLGKGNGRGKKVACTGSGGLTFTVVVEVAPN